MQIKEIIKISKDLNGSQALQPKLSQNSQIVVRRYGNASQFFKTYNPDLQKVCAQNIARTFTGDAPTIALLKATYTEQQVRVWILAQIENLNSFSGTQNKMNPDQMMMLCDIILTDYYYLKASELLLFFYQFKAGRYGQLYGSVDPLRVSNALIEFAAYRRAMIFKYESLHRDEERANQEAERLRIALTRPQYLRRKFVKLSRVRIIRLKR